MSTSLDRALALWRRGFSVIPVPRPRPGVPKGHPGDGKVPAVAWREYQTRQPTETELRRWFADDEPNVAIVTGIVSGIVVVDGDSRDAVRALVKRLTYTPWQVQTAAGYHLYYRHPGGRIPNRARIETPDGRLAVDVRGDGGYVIAAGSVHASGAAYIEAGDWSAPKTSVPVFWRGWLQRPTRSTARRPHAPKPSGDVIERARRYLAAIPKPEIGCGSDLATFCAAAHLVRGFDLDAVDAGALLWEWAGGRDGWTREWIDQKVAHAIRYGSEPFGGMR